MPELKRRFGGADQVPVPDLWEEIQHRRPRGDSPDRRHTGVLVALLVAVGAIALGAVVFSARDRSTNEASSAACALIATFEGSEYEGSSPTVHPVPGEVLGVATVPSCDGAEPWELEVARLDEVDPTIAVVSADAEILLISTTIQAVPSEVARYLEPPSCDPADEPLELRGTWLGILGADGRTEVDLQTPYDITLRVDEASSSRYERAELTVRVPESLGKPLSRADLEASLWEGGDIRVVAECADGGHVAREVEAFPG
ncbi:hypothetical protein BH20ACT24_BH20ACT24_04430 [soil metagenome]